MKRALWSLLLILSLLAGPLLPSISAAQSVDAGPPWYVRGGFNSWGSWLMYDDGTHGDVTAGDGIYTLATTIDTAGRYEWKVDDGNWTDPHPPSNSWIVTTVANQSVTFTFDTNTYADGWSPTHNIVNVQDGVSTWTAVGDWQGWDNGNAATAMASVGSGLYVYATQIATAGVHQFKAVKTGSWDAVGPEGSEGGRSINTVNLDFTTTVPNQPIRFLLNSNTGRIRVLQTALINEFDSQTPGTDAAEFIELYDGGAGNVSLDGLVIVFFNGSAVNDASYYAIDLDGYGTDANGYLVAGNAAVPGVDIIFAGNLLQNGQDAIGLFAGHNTDFPNGTPATNINLIDAAVYDDFPPGVDDPVLRGILLNPGQPMVFEGTDANNDSASRCPNGTGGLRNTETYTATVPTPDGANDCPIPVADVSIAKTGQALVQPGAVMTYTVNYANGGTLAADAVVITDVLPAGVSYVSDTSGFSCPACFPGATGVLTWTVGTVPPASGPLAFDLVSQVDVGVPFGTVLVNNVEITCTADANPANNTGAFTSTVVGSDIAIGKTGPVFAMPGGPISYTLSYDLAGDPAQNTVITDVLPADVVYVSDTAPVTPTNPAPGVYVWNLGTVAASSSFVVNGTVSNNPTGWTITNTAQVESSNDTMPDNNADSWATGLPMPVYEVQHVSVITGTSPSPYLDQHVYLLGTVTAIFPATTYARYNIATETGPWQGIYIYDWDETRQLALGDRLVVGGTVSEYFGMTELGSIDFFANLGNGPLIEPVITTTAAITITSLDTAEALEGVLVEVNCATITRETNNYGEWGFADASGVVAQADDTAPYTYVPVMGDSLAVVRGPLFYSFDMYEIEPRDDGDISLAPGVQATNPADGATGVLIDANVMATFTVALDPATVDNTTFYLEGPGGTLVPATVSYDDVTHIVTLDPDAALGYSTTYTATATTGILSLGGVPMCSEYSWSFTTVAQPLPDLTLSFKIADRLQAMPGDVLTYTIRLINAGEVFANASITDVLPAEVTVLTQTLPPGMSYVGGQLLWAGPVYVTASVPLAFQVQVNAGAPYGAVFTNVVWIDDGVNAPFSKYATVEIPPAPDITVDPLSLYVVLNPGGSAEHIVTVGNVGNSDLNWSLAENPVVGWLSETPTSGAIIPGGSTPVTVTFDATGLPTGLYNTVIEFSSDDPDEPMVPVDVTLLVTETCVPVADAFFTWTPLTPTTGSPVTFSGGATGTEPFTFTWDFGDGTTGSGANPAHTYNTAGDYVVTMTVTNDCGSAVVTHTVTVSAGCLPPSTVAFTWLPNLPGVGQAVAFTGAAQGSEPLAFTWDFGDGAYGTGQAITHTYALTGTFTVVMTVTNACGSDLVAHEVTVVSEPPVETYSVFLPVVFKNAAP